MFCVCFYPCVSFLPYSHLVLLFVYMQNKLALCKSSIGVKYNMMFNSMETNSLCFAVLLFSKLVMVNLNMELYGMEQ